MEDEISFRDGPFASATLVSGSVFVAYFSLEAQNFARFVEISTVTQLNERSESSARTFGQLDPVGVCRFVQFHVIGSKCQGPFVSVNWWFFVADVQGHDVTSGHYPGSD